jgi:hypothetical protein
VAVLGFAADCKAVIPSQTERFRDGLRWMQGRRFFVANRPLGFEADGFAILGVAVGVAMLGDPATREKDERWLVQIADTSLQRAQREVWETSLLEAVKLVLQRGDNISGARLELQPDLAAAFAAKGLAQLDPEDERAAREAIMSLAAREVTMERAAVQLAAIHWLFRQAANAVPKRATVVDLVAILAAVPHALKRWPWEAKARTRIGATPQKWDVQNEYHVQGLLWSILAPIFPDLEDEEYLQSLGHKHPRVDLAIPSLGVIVEVKFVRGGTPSAFAGAMEEVAADTGLYLSGSSPFTEIVAFIWDDSRSTEHHAEFVSGLRKLGGVRDAVVVSRPGGWR